MNNKNEIQEKFFKLFLTDYFNKKVSGKLPEREKFPPVNDERN